MVSLMDVPLSRARLADKCTFSPAFDDLVAHNVDWADMLRIWFTTPDSCEYIQSYVSTSLVSRHFVLLTYLKKLTQGLPFLCSAVRAKTYDKRARLFVRDDSQLKGIRCQPARHFNFMTPQAESVGLISTSEAPLESYLPAQLEQLARPSDGAQDSTASDPFHVWYSAHHSRSNFYSVDPIRNRSLWECGYVLWDYANASAVDFRAKCNEVKNETCYFESYRHRWRHEDLLQSRQRRTEIRLSGGSGYWPWNRIDFSRIHGLSEETETELLDTWISRLELEDGEQYSWWMPLAF